MTIESQVADLTTATTALITAVNVQKVTLDQKVTDAGTQADLATTNGAAQVALATTQAGLATTNGAAQVAFATTQAQAALANANTAGTTNTAVQTALAGTTSAATQAANARDAAIVASQVATAANEMLAAQSQSIHYGAIVKAIIHNAYNDSDGGAWADRCADKSWENEALVPGTWRQQRTNLAACWAVTGAAAGDYYQNTTDGKFYQIAGTSGAPTQTEVFRGNRRKYPKGGIAWIAESGRVVGYDLTVVGCPMWMVFSAVGASGHIRASTVLSIGALNGQLFVGSAFGLAEINFVSDKSQWRRNDYGGGWNTPQIAYRNSSAAASFTIGLIVNITVNDIAVTVLDNAPVDAYGMKVPTVFVGTAGGLSTITNAGTVVNSTATTSVVSVDCADKVLKAVRSDGIVALYDDLANIGVVPSTTLSASTIPAIRGTATKVARRAKGSSTGLTLIQRNPTTQAKSMVAYVTDTIPGFWQNGDIRLATLCDSVAETVTASGELVTNGTFDTVADGQVGYDNGDGTVDGWINGLSATTSIVSGALRITNGVASGGYTSIPFATVIGRTYAASWNRVGGTGLGSVAIGTSGGNNAQNYNLYNGTGTTATFIATTTTTYFNPNVGGAVLGQYYDYDNISCKLATPDRSVKNNGLILNGTLQKTAVASGASLVAYSGFSA